LWLWVAVGFLAYLILPWYAIQEANGLSKIPQVFANEQAGNGLMQAASFGRPWLWLGLAGLVVAAAGAALPAGRRQGAVLLAGGAPGLLALLASGFLIGARGWSFESMTTSAGRARCAPAGHGLGRVHGAHCAA
jgi:iron(III) transport system permease protein